MTAQRNGTSTTISSALADLLDHDIALTDAIDKHFAPGYRQRTNGRWDGREGFAGHIAHLRTIVESVAIDVREELVSGSTYAERHIVDLAKFDGTRVVQEVYVFGDLDADGRFSRIEETTLMLAGDDSDRDIGSAR